MLMGFRLFLQAVAIYIQAKNATAVTKLIDGFYKRFQTLGSMSRIGVQRPELSAQGQSLPIRNCVIFYHEEYHGVDIIRVVDERSRPERSCR
jgi:plasmid stabilization system protein ParE